MLNLTKSLLMTVMAHVWLVSAAQVFAQENSDMDFAEYSRICEALIDEIPALDSRLGVAIPITVNGSVPDKYLAGMNCDKPSLLPESCGQGQCIPYSRVQLLRDDDKVQIVAMFRMKFIREEPLLHEFDEIDLVVHSVTNGATCFFQAKPPRCDINSTLNGTAVPSPQAPTGADYWQPLDKVEQAGCGNCHDNDPFYYSPYIAQVIDHVPADPLGKYYFDIGPFKRWNKLLSINPRGNTCTGCHRIGNTQTCGAGLDQATGGKEENADKLAHEYPASYWMPPNNIWTKAQWDVTYHQSVEDLKLCCGNNGAENCIKRPIK